MKKPLLYLLAIFLFSLTMFSCKEKDNGKIPSKTQKYSVVYTGLVDSENDNYDIFMVVAPGAYGFVTFEDFRNINGVRTPFVHKLGYSPNSDGVIHRMTFEKIDLDPNIGIEVIRLLKPN